MSAGRFAARSSASRGQAFALEADLISRLRSLPVGPRPDARFKSDLRSQLVSITARIVSESAGEAATVAGRGARLAASSSRRGVATTYRWYTWRARPRSSGRARGSPDRPRA